MQGVEVLGFGFVGELFSVHAFRGLGLLGFVAFKPGFSVSGVSGFGSRREDRHRASLVLCERFVGPGDETPKS